MPDNFSEQIAAQKRLQSYNHKVLTHAWNIALAMGQDMYFDSGSNSIIATPADVWDDPEKLKNLSSLCTRFDEQQCLEIKMSSEFRAVLVNNCISDQDKGFVKHFYDNSQDFLPRDSDELLAPLFTLLHKKPELIEEFLKKANHNLGYITEQEFPQTLKLIATSLSPENAVISLVEYLKKQHPKINYLNIGFQEKLERTVIKVLEETYTKELDAGSFNEIDYIAYYQKMKVKNQFAFEISENPVVSLTIDYQEVKYYLDFSYLLKEDIQDWVHTQLFAAWENELCHTNKGLEKISTLYWGENKMQKAEMRINPDTDKVQAFLSVEENRADCLTRMAFVKSLKTLLSFLKDNQPHNLSEMNAMTQEHQKSYWLNHTLGYDLQKDESNSDMGVNQATGKFKI
jgi:hypothetical protein